MGQFFASFACLLPTLMASAALSGDSLLAQLQFSELGKQHLPAGPASGRNLALGDVNGDGACDLVCGNRLYLNRGDGRFTDVTATHLSKARCLSMSRSKVGCAGSRPR